MILLTVLLLFITHLVCAAGFPAWAVDNDTKTMNVISIIRAGYGNEYGRDFNEVSESFVTNKNYNNQVSSSLTSEVYALKTMYDALNGTYWHWKNSSSSNGYKWEFDDAVTTINPCTENWQGITCNCTSNSACHITKIDLSAYRLDGYLSDMTNLTLMVRLTLGNNLQLEGDLSPLTNLTALEYLDLDNTAISGDLSPLSNMIALEHLELRNTNIGGDLSPLSNLIALEYLVIYNTAITGDLSPLSDLTALEHLDLRNIAISGDLSPLSNMIELEYLYLSNTAITGDLSPLSDIPSLIDLSLNYTTISGDLSPLSNLTALENLYLSNTTITGDLLPLSNMTALESLDLHTTAITGDLSPLSNLTGLQVLYLQSTAVSGDLSPLSNMIALEYLDLRNTAIGGDLSPLSNMIALEYLVIHHTSITGDLSPLSNLTALEHLDLYNTAIGGDLSPLSNMTRLEYLYLDETAVSGDLSPLSKMSSLIGLSLNYTAIGGDLSPLSNMTRLESLYLDDTAVTGDLSPLSNMTRLQVLYLSNTAITGDLSPLSKMAEVNSLILRNTAITGDLSPLVNLGSLEFCVLTKNHFHGPIPSLRNISSLSYLNLADNQLTGSINNIFPESLQILDVSNNQLTGKLYKSLFALPNLQLLDASINCLSVQFTEDICNSSSLQYLLLDGLHSSTSCRQVLPIHIVDTIYSTRLNVVSNIPPCLYSLQNLQSLHMAGNGITGALPTNVTLSTSLKELVLANNRMHSKIPTAFQAHDWNTLDLSYNLFVGYLLPSLYVSQSLSLKVNRLSGNIPSTLSDTSDVSILTGNIFTCTPEQLAALHDEVGDRYICGSDSFNNMSILWLVFLVLVLLLVLVSMYTTYGEKSVVGRYVNASIGYLRETRMHGISTKCMESADNKLKLSNIQQIPVLMKHMRQLSGVLTIMIVCIYMPLYSALSYFCGTYYNQYAWTVSVAFLSGESVGIALFVMYTTTLFVASYHNSTVIAESLIYDYKRKEMRRYLVYFVLFAVNLVTILVVNGCYVYALLHYGQAAVLLMEIILSVFKVLWTSYALIAMMRYAHVKYIKAESKPYEHVHFLAIMSIVNSIVQPCLATTLLDTNCFYNMIYSAESITSTFVKSIHYLANGVTTSTDLYSTSSYSPSFVYSYQCSSELLTSYSNIFMIVALFSVILPPTLDYLKILIKKDDREPATNSVARVLLYLIKSTRLLNRGVSSQVIIIDEIYMTKTIISLVGSISVLVTFGVMQPVLGFVTYLTIVIQTTYREYRVEQYVSELLKSASNAPSLDEEVSTTSSLSTESRQALVALDESVKGLGQTLARSIWQLLLFLGPFYGFFVFDIIGDDKGFEEAIWAPITLIVLCLIKYVTPSFLREYIIVTKRIALGKMSNSYRVKKRESEMVSLSGQKQTNEITTNPMNSPFNE